MKTRTIITIVVIIIIAIVVFLIYSLTHVSGFELSDDREEVGGSTTVGAAGCTVPPSDHPDDCRTHKAPECSINLSTEDMSIVSPYIKQYYPHSYPAGNCFICQENGPVATTPNVFPSDIANEMKDRIKKEELTFSTDCKQNDYICADVTPTSNGTLKNYPWEKMLTCFSTGNGICDDDLKSVCNPNIDSSTSCNACLNSTNCQPSGAPAPWGCVIKPLVPYAFYTNNTNDDQGNAVAKADGDACVNCLSSNHISGYGHCDCMKMDGKEDATALYFALGGTTGDDGTKEDPHCTTASTACTARSCAQYTEDHKPHDGLGTCQDEFNTGIMIWYKEHDTGLTSWKKYLATDENKMGYTMTWSDVVDSGQTTIPWRDGARKLSASSGSWNCSCSNQEYFPVSGKKCAYYPAPYYYACGPNHVVTPIKACREDGDFYYFPGAYTGQLETVYDDRENMWDTYGAASPCINQNAFYNPYNDDGFLGSSPLKIP